VAASGAVLINTLHGPSRQILHVLSPVAAHAGKSAAAEAARCGGLLRGCAVVSRQNHTRYGGRVANSCGFPVRWAGASA